MPDFHEYDEVYHPRYGYGQIIDMSHNNFEASDWVTVKFYQIPTRIVFVGPDKYDLE